MRIRNSQTDVVAFESGVTNKDSVTQGTLSHEMKFVLARGKIDGATVFGGDFPVYRHRKSGGDEWCCPWALLGPRFTPRG
jgi:hypothetical protein